MATVRRVGVMSLAKIYAVTMGIFGLILGVISLLIGAMVGAIAAGLGAGNDGLGLTVFGVFGIIVFPIMYGALGFVSGLIGGALYNLVAGWVGGVQIQLDQ